MQYLIKITSIILTNILLLPMFHWAFDASHYPLANSNAFVIQHLGKSIFIPEKLGSSEASYQGQQKTVICIQDLHCHNEVQHNIASIINYLTKHHDLKLVGEEGAFEQVDTSALKDFPINHIRQAVGDHLVKQGKITGAEYYDATGTRPIELVGIETKELYDESLSLVQKFLNAQNQGIIFDLRDSLDEIKSILYNHKLMQYDFKYRTYQDGRSDLITFAHYLKTYSKQNYFHLENYPHLSHFLKINNQNKFKTINHEQLFDEVKALNQIIRHKLYDNKYQQELDSQYERLVMIEKLLNISATQEELSQFRNERHKYSVKAFVAFINSVEEKNSGPLLLDSEYYALDHQLNQVEQFYQLADKRSHVFVDNLIAKMNQHQQDIAVMVNGGFHTEKVLSYLKDKNVSYISVKPRLTKRALLNPYFSLLQGRKTPLEKLIANNQTILQIKSAWLDPNHNSLVIALNKILGYNMKDKDARTQAEFNTYLENHQQVEVVMVTQEEARKLELASRHVDYMKLSFQNGKNTVVLVADEGRLSSKLVGQIKKIESRTIGSQSIQFHQSLALASQAAELIQDNSKIAEWMQSYLRGITVPWTTERAKNILINPKNIKHFVSQLKSFLLEKHDHTGRWGQVKLGIRAVGLIMIFSAPLALPISVSIWALFNSHNLIASVSFSFATVLLINMWKGNLKNYYFWVNASHTVFNLNPIQLQGDTSVYVEQYLPWFIELFEYYKQQGALNQHGIDLLEQAKSSDVPVRELYPIILYFKSIPELSRDELLSDFPENLFIEASIPAIFFQENLPLTFRLTEGCDHGCISCPEQHGKLKSTMVFPLLIQLAKRGIKMEGNYVYEGLYYSDPSGAMFADVLKLFPEIDFLITRDYGVRNAELARQNMLRINELERELDIHISISLSDANGLSLLKRGLSDDAILKIYMQRYMKLINDIKSHNIIMNLYLFNEYFLPDFKRNNEIATRLKDELMLRMEELRIKYQDGDLETKEIGKYNILRTGLYRRVAVDKRRALWLDEIRNPRFEKKGTYVLDPSGRLSLELPPSFIPYHAVRKSMRRKELDLFLTKINQQIERYGFIKPTFIWVPVGLADDFMDKLEEWRKGRISATEIFDTSNFYLPAAKLDDAIVEQYVDQRFMLNQSPAMHFETIHNIVHPLPAQNQQIPYDNIYSGDGGIMPWLKSLIVVGLNMVVPSFIGLLKQLPLTAFSDLSPPSKKNYGGWYGKYIAGFLENLLIIKIVEWLALASISFYGIAFDQTTWAWLIFPILHLMPGYSKEQRLKSDEHRFNDGLKWISRENIVISLLISAFAIYFGLDPLSWQAIAGHIGVNLISNKVTKTITQRKQDKAWITEVFDYYNNQKILSEHGKQWLAKLHDKKTKLTKAEKFELYRIINYFRSIPDMDREQILNEFPEEYFIKLSIPDILKEKANINLLDGCPFVCVGCPSQSHGLKNQMAFPILIMLAKAGIHVNTRYNYEPLIYKDPSGALFADVFKLFPELEAIFTKDYEKGYHAIVKENVARLNNLGKRHDIRISVSAFDKRYYKMKKDELPFDEMVDKYYESYIEMILDLVPYHNVSLRPYKFPDKIMSETIEERNRITEALFNRLKAQIKKKGLLVQTPFIGYSQYALFTVLSKRAYQEVIPQYRPLVWEQAMNQSFTTSDYFEIRADGKVYLIIDPGYIPYTDIVGEKKILANEVLSSLSRRISIASFNFDMSSFNQTPIVLQSPIALLELWRKRKISAEDACSKLNPYVPIKIVEDQAKEDYIKAMVEKDKAPIFKEIPVWDIYVDQKKQSLKTPFIPRSDFSGGIMPWLRSLTVAYLSVMVPPIIWLLKQTKITAFSDLSPPSKALYANWYDNWIAGILENLVIVKIVEWMAIAIISLYGLTIDQSTWVWILFPVLHLIPGYSLKQKQEQGTGWQWVNKGSLGLSLVIALFAWSMGFEPWSIEGIGLHLLVNNFAPHLNKKNMMQYFKGFIVPWTTERAQALLNNPKSMNDGLVSLKAFLLEGHDHGGRWGKVALGIRAVGLVMIFSAPLALPVSIGIWALVNGHIIIGASSISLASVLLINLLKGNLKNYYFLVDVSHTLFNLNPVQLRATPKEELMSPREWYIKVFGEYQRQGILSSRAQNLYDRVSQLSDLLNLNDDRELYRIYVYFNSIPNMNRDQILKEFPSEYFIKLNLPAVVKSKKILMKIMLLDGCDEVCLTCPMQHHKIKESMPYPTLILLAQAGVTVHPVMYYEPLYYQEASGAMFADVLKLFPEFDRFKTRDYGLINTELAKENVKRLNDLGEEYTVGVSVSINGSSYYMLKRDGKSDKEIVNNFLDRYLIFIRDLASIHDVNLTMYFYPEDVLPEGKHLNSLTQQFYDALITSLDEQKINYRKAKPSSYSVLSKRGYRKVPENKQYSAWQEALLRQNFSSPGYIIYPDGTFYLEYPTSTVKYSEILPFSERNTKSLINYLIDYYIDTTYFMPNYRNMPMVLGKGFLELLKHRHSDFETQLKTLSQFTLLVPTEALSNDQIKTYIEGQMENGQAPQMQKIEIQNIYRANSGTENVIPYIDQTYVVGGIMPWLRSLIVVTMSIVVPMMVWLLKQLPITTVSDLSPPSKAIYGDWYDKFIAGWLENIVIIKIVEWLALAGISIYGIAFDQSTWAWLIFPLLHLIPGYSKEQFLKSDNKKFNDALKWVSRENIVISLLISAFAIYFGLDPLSWQVIAGHIGVNLISKKATKTIVQRKQDKAWIIELFDYYNNQNILSEHGQQWLTKLHDEQANLNKAEKDELYRIFEYFKNIPEMDREQILNEFPEEYFISLSIPKIFTDKKLALNINLLDGCPHVCLNCPVHNHGLRGTMAFPIVILLAKANIRVSESFNFEPLSYQDPSGANFADFLKLFSGFKGFITRGEGYDNADDVYKNIKRINKLGKRLNIWISLSTTDKGYKKLKKTYITPEAIADAYVEKYLNFIRQIHHHHKVRVLPYKFSDDEMKASNVEANVVQHLIVEKLRAIVAESRTAKDQDELLVDVAGKSIKYDILSPRAYARIKDELGASTWHKALSHTRFANPYYYIINSTGRIVLETSPAEFPFDSLPLNVRNRISEKIVTYMFNIIKKLGYFPAVERGIPMAFGNIEDYFDKWKKGELTALEFCNQLNPFVPATLLERSVVREYIINKVMQNEAPTISRYPVWDLYGRKNSIYREIPYQQPWTPIIGGIMPWLRSLAVVGFSVMVPPIIWLLKQTKITAFSELSPPNKNTYGNWYDKYIAGILENLLIIKIVEWLALASISFYGITFDQITWAWLIFPLLHLIPGYKDGKGLGWISKKNLFLAIFISGVAWSFGWEPWRIEAVAFHIALNYGVTWFTINFKKIDNSKGKLLTFEEMLEENGNFNYNQDLEENMIYKIMGDYPEVFGQDFIDNHNIRFKRGWIFKVEKKNGLFMISIPTFMERILFGKQSLHFLKQVVNDSIQSIAEVAIDSAIKSYKSRQIEKFEKRQKWQKWQQQQLNIGDAV